MTLFETFAGTFRRPAALPRKNAKTTALLRMMAASAIACSVFVNTSHAELIPSSRLVEWTPGVTVGVPGGIPTNRTKLIDVTASPYNANNTGTSNAAPAIQSAINAAKAGDVVYLPAGTYRIDTSVYIDANKDGITVRGAGPSSTLIDARINTVFKVGTGSDYSWEVPSSGNVVTGGLTKGSTKISIPSTAAFSEGQIVSIHFENQTSTEAIKNGAIPTVSVFGHPRLRRQLTRVTGKTGNSLSIFPAVSFTPDADLSARVNVARLQTDSVGIEDMTIDGSNGSMVFPIHFEQCYGSWVQNVKIVKTFNYGIYFTNSLNCEVRHSEISERKTGGSNGAGILIGTVAGSLFEDNIVLGIFPAFEVNFSSMGNVIAYNVMENSIGGTLNTNHGPHNSFNLYEGNVTPNIQADGYFGGASDDTFFRNWIHGTNAKKTLRTFMVSLNRFTRNYSLVGNIIGEQGTTHANPYSYGNPNMGNSSYKNTAIPSTGNFWNDWGTTATLTKRASDTAGTITLSNGTAFVGQYLTLRWTNGSQVQTVPSVGSISGSVLSWSGGTGTALPQEGSTLQVYFGPGGYQESDLDVAQTTITKANYFYGTKEIADAESIGTEQLPHSLYRSSKPNWFGDLQWPAFDPMNPTPSFASIPAGHRYLNGVAPSGIGAENPPANVQIRVQAQ